MSVLAGFDAEVALVVEAKRRSEPRHLLIAAARAVYAGLVFVSEGVAPDEPTECDATLLGAMSNALDRFVDWRAPELRHRLEELPPGAVRDALVAMAEFLATGTKESLSESDVGCDPTAVARLVAALEPFGASAWIAAFDAASDAPSRGRPITSAIAPEASPAARR